MMKPETATQNVHMHDRLTPRVCVSRPGYITIGA